MDIKSYYVFCMLEKSTRGMEDRRPKLNFYKDSYNSWAEKYTELN